MTQPTTPTRPGPDALTPEAFNAMGEGRLPGLIGGEISEISLGQVKARLKIRPEHHAPNGFLHAASVIALADTACGYGCVASLPEGAIGFTTIELKSNFVATVTDGVLLCEATMMHGGRSTQLWDARVTHEGSGKVLALFRCTQMVLRARTAA